MGETGFFVCVALSDSSKFTVYTLTEIWLVTLKGVNEIHSQLFYNNYPGSYSMKNHVHTLEHFTRT